MKQFILFFLLISLIFIRYFTIRPIYNTGDRVRITTTVFSDPIRYSTSQYLKVALLKTYLPLFPEISYGDEIVVEGTVANGKLNDPKLISVNPSTSPTSVLRNNIISFYQKVLPEPEGGLLSGIVIGAKGALSPDFYNQTKLAGVAHVVVASGTNVTFVVSFLMEVLTLFLTRRKAIVFAILGIILYLFISGFDAPLVRAAIMSSVLFLSQETGRLVSTWRILFITVGVMLIYNPQWLIDIGFILSFVSTASLILFSERIRLKLLKLPKLLREDLATTLAAQIGVAPILFVTFGQFNIWSPLINVLVLWTVPLIMIIGSIGGAVGLVFPFLGKLILYLSYPMLWWFTKIVGLFS